MRGLAVVLMVLDHAILVFGDGLAGELVRHTFTRASLPLFCLVMGSLIVGRSTWPRAGILVGWGLVATVFGFPIGIGQPDVLLILALGLVIVQLAFQLGAWWLLLVVAIVQPIAWRIPWTGYQLGTVIALQVAGALIGKRDLAAVGDRLPAAFEWPGRYPLEIYVAHLVGLWLLGGLR